MVANVFTRVDREPPIVPGTGIVQPRATRQPVRLPDDLHERRTSSAGPFEYKVHADRQAAATARRSACSCTASSTPASGPRRSPAWRRPSSCCATTRSTRGRRTWSNNLEIFILPSVEPRRRALLDAQLRSQRRNLTNHCVDRRQGDRRPVRGELLGRAGSTPAPAQPYTAIDPAARNAWGVDLNRNNTVGTIFDGYIGASYSCISDVYAGPGEASEPEIKNELWIADTFDNIKFSNNIHSFGGYFMWAPGAYLPNRAEGDLVHANIGVEKYFFAAGDRILNRIKEYRNTAILPERTGPIADVLYSAAGNSADEHWYKRDVIAYSFETGADLFFVNTPDGIGGRSTRDPDQPERRRHRLPEAGRPAARWRRRSEPRRPGSSPPWTANPANPNVFFTEPLANAHPADARVEGAALQTGVGFQPVYAPRASTRRSSSRPATTACSSRRSTTRRTARAPQVRMTGERRSGTPIDTTFVFGEEPAVIRYTTDGSHADESSTAWDSTGPREPGEVFHVTRTTTFRWRADGHQGQHLVRRADVHDRRPLTS